MLYLLALLSVSLGAAAQLLLKMGVTNPEVQLAFHNRSVIDTVAAIAHTPAIWFGFGCYGASAIVWMAVLARLPVSHAYPFVSGGIVLVALFGVTLLGESLSLRQSIGLAIVVAGLLLIAEY